MISKGDPLVGLGLYPERKSVRPTTTPFLPLFSNTISAENDIVILT